jgi:hypothetical protein
MPSGVIFDVGKNILLRHRCRSCSGVRASISASVVILPFGVLGRLVSLITLSIPPRRRERNRSGRPSRILGPIVREELTLPAAPLKQDSAPPRSFSNRRILKCRDVRAGAVTELVLHRELDRDCIEAPDANRSGRDEPKTLRPPVRRQ